MTNIDSIKNTSGADLIFDSFILGNNEEREILTLIKDIDVSWMDILNYNLSDNDNKTDFIFTMTNSELESIYNYYISEDLVFTINSIEVIPTEGLSIDSLSDLVSINIVGKYQFTTIEEWDSAHDNSIWDYKYVRDRIKDLVITNTNVFSEWDNLSEIEKEIACRYFVAPLSIIVSEVGENFNSVLDNWINLSKLARADRWEVAKKQVFKELPDGAKQVLKEITEHKLVILYLEGIEGTIEDEGVEGLFDYLESRPGTSFENNGLLEKLYTPVISSNINELSSNIMTILKDGNY